MSYTPVSKPVFLGWRKLRLGLLLYRLLLVFGAMTYWLGDAGIIYLLGMPLIGGVVGALHAANHPAFGITCETCGSTVPLDSRCEQCMSTEE
jgi:hypothetical protein